MTKPMVFTRGMFLGQIVIACGLIAAVLWIALINGHLHNQQKVDAELLKRNTHTITLVCKLATGLSLNQPNLDPHFLRILNDIVGELPQRCFP